MCWRSSSQESSGGTRITHVKLRHGSNCESKLASAGSAVCEALANWLLGRVREVRLGPLSSQASYRTGKLEQLEYLRAGLQLSFRMRASPLRLGGCLDTRILTDAHTGLTSCHA